MSFRSKVNEPTHSGGVNSDIAISLDGVSKCFQIYDKPHQRLLQGVFGTRWRNYSEFWALRDVSFEIEKGETVGIVGRNGAGKSTLLQIISGILAPTAGNVQVNGRVAALLELGAGFNPEFTGRENVYIYATVLGLSSKEIEEKFDDIAAFADIGDFLEQPVKRYSSGMFVRLAFSVTTCIEPDILIIDEALGVGDVKFQAKCFRRFEDLVSRGTTILFVTHSTEQIVRHCPWSILLEHGQVKEKGDSKRISNLYLDLMFGEKRTDVGSSDMKEVESEAKTFEASKEQGILFEDHETYNPDEHRWGNGQAEIVNYLVTRDGKTNVATIIGNEPFSIIMTVKYNKDALMPIYGLIIKTPDGVTLYQVNSREFSGGPLFRSVKNGERVQVDFSVEQRLGPGEYLVSLGVAEQTGASIVPLDRRYDSFVLKVTGDGVLCGFLDMAADIEIRSV